VRGEEGYGIGDDLSTIERVLELPMVIEKEEGERGMQGNYDHACR